LEIALKKISVKYQTNCFLADPEDSREIIKIINGVVVIIAIKSLPSSVFGQVFCGLF
jgi:hypothetical protein